MWEPRLKSQRICGREREAFCDWIMGRSNAESVAMAPDDMSATEMLVAWRMSVVVAVDGAMLH